MTKAQNFWDKAADKYAKSPIGDEAAYRFKLEKTRAYFSPECQVLEFGCGTGSTALLHAPFVGNYLATDLSPRMLAIAREKAAAQKISNVTFQQSALSAIDPAKAQYDVVIGHSILHLLAEFQTAIAQAFQLTKPGGVFISGSTCIKDLGWYLRPLLSVGQIIGKVPEVAVFTKAELEAAMLGAGFQLEFIWQPAPKKAVFIVARRPV